jgi:hypothetical protein
MAPTATPRPQTKHQQRALEAAEAAEAAAARGAAPAEDGEDDEDEDMEVRTKNKERPPATLACSPAGGRPAACA